MPLPTNPAYAAFLIIGDAIINNTLTVADAGPEVWLTGRDRDGIEYNMVCQIDGTITVEVCEDD